MDGALIILFCMVLLAPLGLYALDKYEAPTSFKGALRAKIAGSPAWLGAAVGSNLGRYGNALREWDWWLFLAGLVLTALMLAFESYFIGRRKKLETQ